MGLLKRALPALGTLYLVYLALQPPPVQWFGLLWLAIVTPLWIGWLLGHVAGIGPWAPDEE
ncbi:MAG: hypothetical protein ABEI57_02655 [Halapricum sp.]